ncbi:MAG: protein kinase [Candidatus Melainabacteria bacterium]|nr:protein kinase [Candidatus Melainabacteria bacterium]
MDKENQGQVQTEAQQGMTMVCLKCQVSYPSDTAVCPVDGGNLTPVLPDPLLGTIFAEKYEILAVIGRGGMSTVYKARHTLMDSLVAIKILNSQLVSDPLHIERFTKEAKTLSSLKHLNIVQVFDFGIFDNAKPYLITEYLEGESLADVLQTTTHLSLERAVHIFLQICDGLMVLHKKGIVHRDLKTGNIFIMQENDARDVVKILDFGIAKMLGDNNQDQRLTKEGEVFGSPLYMSPEQCTGGEVDCRSDIYSFGCLMYESLVGAPPHVGASTLETLNKQVSEPTLSLRGIAPELTIPELLDSQVIKALSKNPFQRQQTVEELKKGLIEAAKRSRIHIESLQKAASYEPSTFDTGPRGGEFVPDVDDAMVKQEQEQKEKKQLQSLVLDAISLTEKQDRERKRLKQYIYGLYALLGAGLLTCALLLTWPGPDEDRGPVYQKLLWQFELAQGDQAAKQKAWQDAEEHYKKAAAQAKGFGDQGDRYIKSELALLKLYEDTGRGSNIAQVKMNIAEADTRRIEAAANYEGKKHLKSSFHTSIDVDDLDKASAKKYSEHFTKAAKAYLAKGKIEEAHRALEKAIAIEEVHSGTNGQEVVDCAHKILDGCNQEDHKREARTLVERAELAHKKG